METGDYKVFVVRIEQVEAHPNADRLDLVHVRGWQCVTQRGAFTVGDLAVYLPIDSILPPTLEAALFPLGSKVTLSASRIKTIKIRGAISQGMALTIDAVRDFLHDRFEEGMDVTVDLGITHYEPPAPAASMRGDATAKPSPLFPAYGKINHFKNYPYLFEEDEEVVVTEKVHGTNFRAGWVPTQMDTLWKRVKRWCGLLPQWEFVFGSHNVQLDSVEAWKGFYPHNVYHEAVQQYELCRRIPLGTIVYGEIYGAGIQKGYTYGLHESRSLVLFDARIQVGPMQWYVSWSELESLALKIGLPTVPVVYRGPYRKALVTTWEAGPSLLGEQAHREGCVVKPATEQTCWIGRRMLRSINPEYLLRAESEWH